MPKTVGVTLGALLVAVPSLAGCSSSDAPESTPFTVAYTADDGTNVTVEIAPVDPHCSVFGDAWSYLGIEGDAGVGGLIPIDATSPSSAVTAQLGDGLTFLSQERPAANEDGFVATDLAGRVAMLEDDGSYATVSEDASISGTFTC
ncbi:hypothetical protein [Cellulomonas soli]|uniref:Lipoprotein n=1 Tax=Cellulomonas soli TaxID=931535 RepID=A0A512PGH9_9CELL|nr:hypothetical protein [Cellulomonas soli]NYI58174.1 hypothetical protein [Cellulomonas soli]GEP70307.1 hypothetical protein CSO01_30220 [Cellulomonas soli]